jgi:hypothetical protein
VRKGEGEPGNEARANALESSSFNDLMTFTYNELAVNTAHGIPTCRRGQLVANNLFCFDIMGALGTC